MAAPAAPRRRFFRPTWARIDLAALRRNLALLRRRAGRAKLLFVVKADAYGHGAAACARAAQSARAADWLGVSSVEEGVRLREAGVRLPILVLGSLYPFESVLAAAAYGLVPSVASLEAARRVDEAARRLGRRVPCHVEVDTGMGRFGVAPASAPAVLEALRGLRGARAEGIYTHFSRAGEDRAFTGRQLGAFRSLLGRLARAGLRPPLAHAANSAALLEHPASRLDLVRPGLAAYGLMPGFEPVLAWATQIVYLKTVEKGTPVSYGAVWRAPGRRRLATLPVGYADGYPRVLSGRAEVLVGGRRCPVVGRVTMDQIMVDVSAVPGARVGDEAVLAGSQGGERVPLEELAERAGTVVYEIAARLSPRVPRVEEGA